MTQYKGDEKKSIEENQDLMEKKLKVWDTFLLGGEIYCRVDARSNKGDKWVTIKPVIHVQEWMKNQMKEGKLIIDINSREHLYEILTKFPNVIVDFTATWCGPCHYLKPILKRINREMAEVQIVTVDVDKQEPISDEFNVMAMPTLIAFQNGKRLTGELEEQEFMKLAKEIKKKFKL